MLQGLLEQVKNAIFNDPTTPHRPGFDPSGLIGQIEGMFGQHQQQMQAGGGNYGYADGGHVRPASQDPYGDPADQMGGGSNIRPASEDPLGDPADQR